MVSDPIFVAHEERVQGRKLLIALLLLVCMGITGGLIAAAIYSFLIYWLFGFTSAWSGKPQELITHPNLIFLLGGLLISLLGLAVKLWHRLFVRSGYISPHTQEQLAKGIWPVVGGYWKPVGYVIYIGTLSYGAYLGYVQEGLRNNGVRSCKTTFPL